METRVVRHYTRQCTRYERDKRGERNELGWIQAEAPPRQVLINKHTVRQPIQFDSYAGTKEIELDVFPLKCQKTLAALERINCIKSRDVRRGSRVANPPPSGYGCVAAIVSVASLRASFEFESGLHSSGIMHHLATLEMFLGTRPHMCSLINSLEFWGWNFPIASSSVDGIVFDISSQLTCN